MAATPATPPPLSPPPLPKAFSELRSLAADLANFFAIYDDLQSHLDGINTAIDRRNAANPPEVPGEIRSETEQICESMDWRRMRKHIAALLETKDAKAVRGEIAEALAKNAEMVSFAMGCVGRFYCQGRKAFEKQGVMTALRRSGVLVLEAFLIAGGAEKVDAEARQQAATVAMEWNKRILQEGGFGQVTEMDARGFLLYLASFGISLNLESENFISLLTKSELLKDLEVIRASAVLRKEAEDLVQIMVQKRKIDEALELVVAFGFEEKFPPATLVTSFLNEVFENTKQPKKEGQGPPNAVKPGIGEQLAALKMVAPCVKKYKIKIDPSVFPHVNIDQKIKELERSTSNSKKTNDLKRKGVEPAALPIRSKAKRQRLTRPTHSAHTGRNLPHQGMPGHSLHRVEEYRPPLLSFPEMPPAVLASPNTSHLIRRGGTGMMMEGPQPIMAEDIVGRAGTGLMTGRSQPVLAEVTDSRAYFRTRIGAARDPFAGEEGADIYARGDAGVGPLVNIRQGRTFERGLRDPGPLLSEERSRIFQQQYYDGYMEATQGYGGVQSNGGAAGSSSRSSGYGGANAELEAAPWRTNESLMAPPSAYGRPPTYN